MSYPSNVANDQLRAFVERVERLEEEIKDLNRDKSEVYAEAKGNGFDVPTIKKVVRIRKLDDAERMEADALLSLYLSALGMAEPEDDSTSHVHAHAHVENIDEFDPETGEIKTAGELVAPSAEAADHGNVVTSGGDAAATANPGGEDVEHRPVHVSEEPGLGSASVNAPAEGGTHSASNSNSAPVPPEQSVADSDRGGGSPPPSSAPVASRQAYNPDTHFANSKGLLRLHGCLKPELCGSPQPRLRHCFDCSLKHDGPPAQNGAAA